MKKVTGECVAVYVVDFGKKFLTKSVTAKPTM